MDLEGLVIELDESEDILEVPIVDIDRLCESLPLSSSGDKVSSSPISDSDIILAGIISKDIKLHIPKKDLQYIQAGFLPRHSTKYRKDKVFPLVYCIKKGYLHPGSKFDDLTLDLNKKMIKDGKYFPKYMIYLNSDSS